MAHQEDNFEPLGPTVTARQRLDFLVRPVLEKSPIHDSMWKRPLDKQSDAGSVSHSARSEDVSGVA